LLSSLRAANAEVLICYAYPRKIPAEVLALFPFGGLNLHPALLPNYPGPFPLHRMILDDTYLVHGGMSLHRMTEKFDAGSVLAYARFSPQDWTSLPALHDALAATMERLAAEAIPIFLRGQIQGKAQFSGGSPWASLDRTPVMVLHQWTSGRLQYVCRFLGSWPGVCVDVGGHAVRLLEQIGSTASATGAPPAVSRGSVSFDLADGRVTYRIRTRITRRMVKLRQRLLGGKIGTGAVTVIYPERDPPASSDKA
jgi:methionyl-tRNA formyltransferase